MFNIFIRFCICSNDRLDWHFANNKFRKHSKYSKLNHIHRAMNQACSDLTFMTAFWFPLGEPRGSTSHGAMCTENPKFDAWPA